MQVFLAIRPVPIAPHSIVGNALLGARFAVSIQSYASGPFLPVHHPLLLSSGSLLSGVAPQLLLRLGLDGPLGPADGAGARDGGGAEVGTVSVLGGLVGNGAVGPVR